MWLVLKINIFNINYNVSNRSKVYYTLLFKNVYLLFESIILEGDTQKCNFHIQPKKMGKSKIKNKIK